MERAICDNTFEKSRQGRTCCGKNRWKLLLLEEQGKGGKGIEMDVVLLPFDRDCDSVGFSGEVVLDIYPNDSVARNSHVVES